MYSVNNWAEEVYEVDLWAFGNALRKLGVNVLSPPNHFRNEGALSPRYTRSFVRDGVISVIHRRVAREKSKILRLSGYLHAGYEMKVQEQRGLVNGLRLTWPLLVL